MQHRFLSIISFALFLLLLSNSQLYPQVKNKKDRFIIFSLGMGLNYGATPSYTDYVKNEVPYSTGDSIKTFSAGIEFFGGVEYEFTRTISAKVDYSYYIRSNNYSFGIYVFDYTITSHQPYIMAYYNLKYHNYTFKFGAGAGFHLFKLDNDVNSTNTLTYTANGFSFRAEVIFAPKLSNKLYTYLGGFAYATSTSSLKDENGNLLKGSSTGKEVNLGGYGVGARLGLSFYF